MTDSFVDNKYHRLYFKIIDNAIQRNSVEGYLEQHHIIPRSLGGSDDSSNLVKLTAREHFICHLLLTKFTEGIDKSKMVYALRLMSGNITLRNGITLTRYKPKSSYIYEMARTMNAGPRSEQTRINISLALKGWTLRKTPEDLAMMKDKLSRSNVGKKLSAETKLKMGLSRRGKPRSLETLHKMSIAQTGISKSGGPKIRDKLKYAWTIKDPTGNLHAPEDLKIFCDFHDITYSSLIRTLKSGQALQRGNSIGWQVIGRTK